MSDEFHSEQLTVQLQKHLSNFEDRWKVWGQTDAGERPSLETAWKKAGPDLESAADAERDRFLYELLYSDIWHRKKNGDDVQEAEYRALFRGKEQVISAVFRKIIEASVPAVADARQKYSFLDPPQGQDEIGRLGKYRIFKVIDNGNMGIVFEAEEQSQPSLNRREALKVMKPEMANCRNLRDRFFREARSAARIHHPNVVVVYKVENEPVPFLAMELLQGESLKRRLEQCSKLSVAEVLRLGQQIAEGLQAAHDQKVIHRDLKPANIWLESNPHDHIKILDFGLAFMPDDANLTQSGVAVGTPNYWSPEQACGKAETASDLYSLGKVLCEMATGKLPTSGEDALDALRTAASELPKDVVSLIASLLSEAPGLRPSAKAVASVLKSSESTGTSAASGKMIAGATDLRVPARVAHKENPRGLEGALGDGRKQALQINVPCPPCGFFTGRAEEIATCSYLLNRQHRVVLIGPSGLGKTEIALAYAHKYQGEYQYVIWANAESTKCLSRNFTKIASSLKLSLGRKKIKTKWLPSARKKLQAPDDDEQQTPAVAAVKRWLERNRHWLLVLDNADDLKIVQPFLPKKTNGHVLLTTEVKTPSGLAAPIRISPLPPKDGASLVLRRAGLIRPDQELKDVATKDRKAALDISKEMAGDPLALDIAGAFIAQVKLELSSYLKNYRQQREIERGHDDWQTIVQTTCGLTYHEVTQANRAAGDLFRLCSLMALEEIPEDVLLAAGRLATGVHGEQLRGPSEFDAAIEILSNFSLLRRRPYTNTISMHRLVRDAQDRAPAVAQDETRLVCDALAVLEALDWMPHDGTSLHSSATSRPPILQVVDYTVDAGCGIWRGIERLVSVPSLEFALLRKICIARYGCFGATPTLFFSNWFDIYLTEWLESLPGDHALRYEIQDYFSWLEKTRSAEQEAAKQRGRDASFPPCEQPGRLRRVGPDDACPCGSGKKFKECCCDKPSPDDTKLM